MKKTFMLGSLAIVAAVSAVLLNSVHVSADAGDTGQREWNREIVKLAVESGDYNTLSTELQAKISVEKFAEMQAHHAQKAAHLAELEEVVKNNDFRWFLSLMSEKKAEKEAKRAEKLAELETTNPEKFAKIQERMANKTELTDEEKEAKAQEKFTQMTEYYAENGELPKMKKWGKRGFGGKRGR